MRLALAQPVLRHRRLSRPGLSDDFSSLAGVGGRQIAVSDPKFGKLASYMLCPIASGKEAAEAEGANGRDSRSSYPVRLQIINLRTSAPAPNLQIQAVAANGDNE
jgi:hypothetical protein